MASAPELQGPRGRVSCELHSPPAGVVLGPKGAGVVPTPGPQPVIRRVKTSEISMNEQMGGIAESPVGGLTGYGMNVLGTLVKPWLSATSLPAV